MKPFRSTARTTVERAQALDERRDARDALPPTVPVPVEDADAPPAPVRFVVAPARAEEPPGAASAAAAPKVPSRTAEPCMHRHEALSVRAGISLQKFCDDPGDGRLRRASSPRAPERAARSSLRMMKAVSHVDHRARVDAHVHGQILSENAAWDQAVTRVLQPPTRAGRAVGSRTRCRSGWRRPDLIAMGTAPGLAWSSWPSALPPSPNRRDGSPPSPTARG
jgi:hypothetical protein